MAAASLQSRDDIRCLLEQAENSLTSLNKRIETMEGKQQQQHKKMRAALEDKERKAEAIKERINEMNGKHQKTRQPHINKEALRTLKNRLKQIEEKQHEQNHQLRSALDQEEKNLSSVKESFKQITNLQQQKHISIRSDLREEEERIRSSNMNRSTMGWIFSSFTNCWNGTGNQNPSNEIECDHEDQHHAIRSSLEQEKKNLDSLQRSIKQIEEIQRQEEHQLTSALQPDEKQSQLQREDIKTADMVSLQKRFKILEDFQKRLKIRSSEREEKCKLLVKRLDQIKNFFTKQHEDVSLQYVDEVQQQQPHSERRAFIEEKETHPLLQRSSYKEKEKERETEDFKRILNDEQLQLRSELKEQQRQTEALQQRLNYEEMQHQNRRSALKEKDVKIKDLQERIEDMKNNEQKQHHLRSSHKEKEIEDLKRIIKEKDEQLKLISRIQEKEVAQQKHKQRSLKDKEKETEDLKRTVREMEAQLQNSSFALKNKEDEHEKLKQSFQAFCEQQNRNARSLKDKEKETEALKRIINEKDKQLQLMKSAPKDKEKETEALLQRSLKDKEKETEALKQTINEKDKQLQLAKSGSGKQTEIEPLLQRVQEMEAQLEKSRSALREKDEQLKSFKDRVAGEVALSIKTGNTMSLNNPVSKNRLKEIYEDLRCDWPKIKKNLKSNNKHPDFVKELILKEFREAKIEMRNRRMMIDKVFECEVKNAGGTPQKVDQYRQLTVQNLQMTLYSEKQDAGLQKPFLENEAGNPQDVMEYLGSECYWLGCLMALNNPPLQPDWENHPPSMDRWDLFPRNIRPASENE